MGQGIFGRAAAFGRASVALALALLLQPVAADAVAQDAARRSLPLRIDCPDAPLYAAGGLSLLRDPNQPGLALVARLRHARGEADYAVSCRTEAVPGAGAAGAAAGEYDFVCVANRAGRESGGAQARIRGTVPGGHGLDHPDVQQAIAASVCPAARLALARYRAAD